MKINNYFLFLTIVSFNNDKLHPGRGAGATGSNCSSRRPAAAGYERFTMGQSLQTKSTVFSLIALDLRLKTKVGHEIQ